MSIVRTYQEGPWEMTIATGLDTGHSATDYVKLSVAGHDLLVSSARLGGELPRESILHSFARLMVQYLAGDGRRQAEDHPRCEGRQPITVKAYAGPALPENSARPAVTVELPIATDDH